MFRKSLSDIIGKVVGEVAQQGFKKVAEKYMGEYAKLVREQQGSATQGTGNQAPAKPAGPLETPKLPDKFAMLIDYIQGPEGDFSLVKIISWDYTGPLTLSAEGRTETMNIKAGEAADFKMKLIPVPGAEVSVKAGGETRALKFRYDSFQAFDYGAVENEDKFTENTVVAPYLDTKSSVLSVYHLAETEDTCYGKPGNDTVWYCVSENDRTTMADKTGVKTLVKKPLKPGKKYYLNMLFFENMNFAGGAGGVEITAG